MNQLESRLRWEPGDDMALLSASHHHFETLLDDVQENRETQSPSQITLEAKQTGLNTKGEGSS